MTRRLFALFALLGLLVAPLAAQTTVPTWTDFLALMARVADLEARVVPPPPFTLQSAGPWSACQPDATRHRSEVWSNGVTTETRIGHEPCTFTAPSVSTIVYRVEMFQGAVEPPHDHVFVDVAEMRTWVGAWAGPEVGQYVLRYRDYDGQRHEHVFPSLSAFTAFLAAFAPPSPPPSSPGELAFPGQSRWRELWPDFDPRDLAKAPAGWISCEGYPQRRAHVGAQWHDSPNGDLDGSPHHQHVETCLPSPQEPIAGVVQFDVRVIAFHYDKRPGFAFKFLKASLKGAPSGCEMLPAPATEAEPGQFRTPLTAHLEVFYVPVRFDTRCVDTDGLKELYLSAGFLRLADGETHQITLSVPVRVENGGGRVRRDEYEGFRAIGWGTKWVTDPVRCARVADAFCEINTWGYLNAILWHWWPGDPTWTVRLFADDPTPAWSFSASGQFPLRLEAFVNPDLHAHPPQYGVAAMSPTTVTTTSVDAWVQPLLRAGDRIVFRAADDTPGNPHGSAATLLTIKLGPAK